MVVVVVVVIVVVGHETKAMVVLRVSPWLYKNSPDSSDDDDGCDKDPHNSSGG